MGLRDKLNRIQRDHKDSQIDWNARIDRWKSQVETLYDHIHGWLSDYSELGYARGLIRQKTIHEESAGQYQISSITLSFGMFEIELDPQGMDVIGGKGRVDMYFNGNKPSKYMLILIEDDNGNDNWIAVPYSDRTSQILLTKNSLEMLIEKWIDESYV